MKLRVLLFAFLLSVPLTPSISATPPKAGAICSKAGITKNYNGKKYTCMKSGKKLVWSQGVQIKVAAPLPMSSPAVKSSPVATPTATPTVVSKALDALDFRNLMIYDVKDSQLIRRADSGSFYESDSRTDSNFSEIRQRAFRALNSNLGKREHSNIQFIYDIQPSYPSNLIDFTKRELDEAASLWNDYFKEKLIVNVFLGSEKDREYIKSNNWLNRNMPSCFDRWETGRERSFICAGGAYFEQDKRWTGNLFFAFPSNVDLNNINFDWPVGPKHEFFHIVQDFAFYRKNKDKPRDLHELVQPIHFREGGAHAVSFLTSFGNLGWSSDALDWQFWDLTRSSQKWRKILTVEDAVQIMTAMECLKTCAVPTADDPTTAFYWAYGYGAIMYEWVIGNYGWNGLTRILDQLADSTDFDQVTRGALGLSKEDFYLKVAPYILEQIRRTAPYN